MNNLRQFSVAINVYRNDHENTAPSWLSSLYSSYVSNKRMYLCRSDRSNGAEGSKPEDLHREMSASDWDFNQFRETDDNKGRNGIDGCSYFYELCGTACSYCHGEATYSGSGLTNNATWYEVKMYELNNLYKGEETVFPVVRCFNHYKERTISVTTNGVDTMESPVTLNVAYAGNVLFSGLDWTLRVVEK
jgi:hypothetical protein